MPLHLSFIRFLIRHPLALVGSLLIHVGVIGVFWLSSDEGERKKTFNLSQSQKIENNQPPRPEPDIEEPQSIQAEAVNSQDIEQQIALLKKQRSDKKKAEKIRLKNIEQQQQKLKKAEKAIDQKKKKLAQARRAEEANLAKLKQQKEALDKQRKELVDKTKKESQRLAEQKKKATELKQNLQQIQAEEESVAERLKNLQKKTKDTKKANKEAIKAALKQQRKLEAKRLQEELKIEQAKHKQSQLEKEKLAATKNLQQLSQQQQNTSQKLAESKQKKQEIDRANRQQLSVLKTQYFNSIQIRVKEKWRRPVNTDKAWTCEVFVQQTVMGEVEQVSLKNCSKSASKRFKESVEKAVYRADPLPQPPDLRVFDKNITFLFKP